MIEYNHINYQTKLHGASLKLIGKLGIYFI
jgi:hypothetical protein